MASIAPRYLAARLGGPERVAAAHAELERQGEASGIRFRFDLIERMPNTRRSHLLIAHAARYGPQAAVKERSHARLFRGRLRHRRYRRTGAGWPSRWAFPSASARSALDLARGTGRRDCRRAPRRPFWGSPACRPLYSTASTPFRARRKWEPWRESSTRWPNLPRPATSPRHERLRRERHCAVNPERTDGPGAHPHHRPVASPIARCTCTWRAPFSSLRRAAAPTDSISRPVSSFRDFSRQLTIWNGKFSGARPMYDASGRRHRWRAHLSA